MDMSKRDKESDPHQPSAASPAASERQETRRRGFASMDGTLQRTISSKGGKAAHAKGKAHEFTADEAREAGRKGGRSISQNREHMARIGREGGKARGRSQREKKSEPIAAE